MLYTTCDLMLDDRIPPTKLSEQYNREEVVIVCARISWYYTVQATRSCKLVKINQRSCIMANLYLKLIVELQEEKCYMSCRNKETEKSLARCSMLSSRIDCVMAEVKRSMQEREPSNIV